MRKKILIMLLIGLCALTGGCGTNDTIHQTEADALVIGGNGTYEWISPEGVHYWVVRAGHGYAIAPRYDNNGNLIIDKENE